MYFSTLSLLFKIFESYSKNSAKTCCPKLTLSRFFCSNSASEDDTIVNYVNKNSLNHNLGNGLHTLIIEGTLTSIGGWAFGDCTRLQSVSLPSVTSIGDYAFYYCKGLQSIILPSVTSIGDGAFTNCTGLQSVSLPSVTNIRVGSFFNCKSLQSISLPSVTSIGINAFGDCIGLQSISLPSVTSIGNDAFSGCSSLQSISFNWSTSETILIYKSRWGVPNDTVFSIPQGTKVLYENKGYPSDRLVERSE